MHALVALSLLLYAHAPPPALCLPEEPKVTYYDLWLWGLDEYNEGNWYDAMTYMKRAQEDYTYFRGEMLRCRVECDEQLPMTPEIFSSPGDGAFFFPIEYSEAAIFDRVAKRSLCVEFCAQRRLTSRPAVRKDTSVEKAMQQLEPYSYAQFCFYKMDQMEHAVKHAYTYLVRNPGNELMSENLGYYMKHDHFKEEFLVDMAEKPYQLYYEQAMEHYEDKDYEMTIDSAKRSLESLWAELRNCRIMCDDAFDLHTDDRLAHDWHSAITSMYASVLTCRLQCVGQLSIIKGNHLPNLLPSLYNYMQFSYFHSGQLALACGAVETYLMLVPDDKDMKENRRLYNEAHRAHEHYFTVDHNAATFLTQHSADRHMLTRFHELFETDYSGAMSAPTPSDYKMLRIADLQSANSLGLYTKEEWDKLKSGGDEGSSGENEDGELPVSSEKISDEL